MIKLKIYSDRSKISNGRFVDFLLPVWEAEFEEDDPDNRRFEKYMEAGREIIELTNLKDAHFAVYPLYYNEAFKEDRSFLDFLDAARNFGKKTVLFFSSDFDYDIPFDDAVIFRTTMYRSSQKGNEFAIPGFCDDFIERKFESTLPVRSKSAKPVVGFCGYHAPPVRTAAINVLNESGLIDTNFIVRDAWWAGCPPRSGADVLRILNARSEFLDNIVNSDYGLCVRGSGNFSYRLYEVLCCGRIPVFVNTDCVLPFDFEVDWKEFCVWVESGEIAALPERIMKFHEGLSDEEFVELQKKCRNFWLERLSPLGFYGNFHRHFPELRLEKSGVDAN